MDNLIFLIVIIVGMLVSVKYFGTPIMYRLRSCAGSEWKRKYPHRNKNEIRDYLEVFIWAFALNEKDKLKFQPADKLMDIYRQIYPSKWLADSLELETFAEDLQNKYGISLDEMWHDEITLGEVFERVSA